MIPLEIKKHLPHGAIKEIAKRTNLSTTTISHVLNGVVTSPKQSEIIKATAEYLKKYKANENEAERDLYEALNIDLTQLTSKKIPKYKKTDNK